MSKKKPKPVLRMIPQTLAEWDDEIMVAFTEALDQMVGDDQEKFGAAFEHNHGNLGLELIGLGAKHAVAARGMTKRIPRMTLHLGRVLDQYAAMAQAQPDRFRDNPPLVFAAVYLLSHVGMDLIDNEKVSEVLNYMAPRIAKIAATL